MGKGQVGIRKVKANQDPLEHVFIARARAPNVMEHLVSLYTTYLAPVGQLLKNLLHLHTQNMHPPLFSNIPQGNRAELVDCSRSNHFRGCIVMQPIKRQPHNVSVNGLNRAFAMAEKLGGKPNEGKYCRQSATHLLPGSETPSQWHRRASTMATRLFKICPPLLLTHPSRRRC